MSPVPPARSSTTHALAGRQPVEQRLLPQPVDAARSSGRSSGRSGRPRARRRRGPARPSPPAPRRRSRTSAPAARPRSRAATGAAGDTCGAVLAHADSGAHPGPRVRLLGRRRCAGNRRVRRERSDARAAGSRDHDARARGTPRGPDRHRAGPAARRHPLSPARPAARQASRAGPWCGSPGARSSSSASSTTAPCCSCISACRAGSLFDGEPCGPHEHLTFAFDDGTVLRFVDPRRFGMVDLWPAERLDRHRWLEHLGLEPLDPGFRRPSPRGRPRRPAQRAQGGADGPAHRGRGGQHLCQREPVPRQAGARARPPAAWHRARPDGWRGRSGRCCARRSKPVAPPCATTSSPTASSATSSADFASTTGLASPACVCGGPVGRIVQGARATFFCAACQR